MRIDRRLPTAVGLLVALGGPALLAPLQRLLGDGSALSGRLLGQAMMWGLLVAIIALVVLWEDRPLRWRSSRWFTCFWGWGPLPAFLISGSVATAFYLWRRDLLAVIVGHALTGAAGFLLLTPAR